MMTSNPNRPRHRVAGWLRLCLLAAGSLLLGCKIIFVSGPLEVAIGDTVEYVLEIRSTSSTASFVVVADVPAGWQLESATLAGTVDGAPLLLNGLVVQSEDCNVFLGQLRPEYRRWHIQRPLLPDGAAVAETGEVRLEFTVESQPAGELRLFFALDGDFECSPPEVLTINRQLRPRFLTLAQALFDDSGVDGLGGPVEATPSPDGRHLYVAGGVDGAIAVFSRDETSGLLAFVEAELEGLGTGEGLGPSVGVTASPDGLHLYVPRMSDPDAGLASAIAIFSRDPATGELTFVERILENVDNLAVSPDGRHLYAGATGITVFSRDPTDGRLTFVESLGPGGRLELSPDGRHLYALRNVFAGDDVHVYGREAASGRLTLLDSFDPVFECRAMAISPDGRHLYLLSDVGLDAYERDETTGLLSLVETRLDLTGTGVAAFPESVAVSPGGSHVVVGGQVGVTVFRRNAASGGLTFVESDFTADLPICGVEGPGALAFAPGSRHLYAASLGDDALATFATAVVFHDGFESGTTSAWSSAVP